ncbi:MAG: ammonium transporter [Acidimicrobiales bacterium]
MSPRPRSRTLGRAPATRRALVGLGVAVTALLAFPAIAGAQEEADPVVSLGQQVNLLWLILGAVLVIFMQAGFALVETGFCRAKHAAHVVSTNFAIFGLGFVAFFLVGYAFMFGGFSYVLPGYDFGYTAPIGESFIKAGDWVFLWKGGFALDGWQAAGGAGVLGYFIYMVAFMDTVATIPTGSMAERWQWKNFVLWGFFCGAIYYPLFGAWTWGGGWLNQLGNNVELGFGYVDFAGSGIVHAMGGAAALAGAIVIGPRIGKFNADGSANTIPGHHIPMAMLGTFILLFGWFGFNAASTFAVTDVQFAVVATNTAIAAAFGAVAAMVYIMFKSGKPDPGMMANGMLAGLVAITAPCAFVSPQMSALIGVIAALLVIESIYFFERRGIDDCVGAISVHGIGGSFGALAVGIFANGSYGAGWNVTGKGLAAEASGVTGVLYDFELGIRQLGAQAIGVLVIWTVMFGIAYGWFKLSDKITPIRSSEADEIGGLDIPEMGALAYPEFEKAIEGSDPEIGERELIGSARGSVHQGEHPS